jgi:hypothetical protein
MGSWVRIPFQAVMSVCVYSVLSCLAKGVWTGLIPRPWVLQLSIKIHNTEISSQLEQATEPGP